MERARPRLQERPCPACGSSVEPLRAREVVLLDDGFRFLCDATCRRRFLDGDRAHDAVRPAVPRAPLRKRAPTPAPAMPSLRAGDRTGAFDGVAVAAEPLPWFGLVAAGLGLVFAAFGNHALVAGLSALGVLVAAISSLVQGFRRRAEVGWFGWALPSAGAILATGAALLPRGQGQDPRLWLAGAAVAGASVVLRTWLDGGSNRSVTARVRRLTQCMPTEARIARPAAAGSTEIAWDEVRAARLRAGQEVLVGEGEGVAVDGVVQAGEGYVLLHPTARTPVHRRPGEPVLAGAVVTEGAIRVLATRVGDERALIRPRTFARAQPGAARVTRIAVRAVQLAGPGLLLLAGVAAIGAVGTSLSAALAAAAAVLLAAPLVALCRAATAPFVAAGATAAQRGIAFANARALERAGRATVTALCSHGTVTEGEPEVVEILSIGDAQWERSIALAAGAEGAAPHHPVARAIDRFCERRGIEPALVRRRLYIEGRGVTAVTPDGQSLVVGNRALLLEQGVGVAVADASAARAEQQGHSVAFVGLGGRTQAVISLSDEDRLGARAAVQRLIDLQIEVVLLSGDHRATVEALAARLDISHVKAELLPEERGEVVTHLRGTSGLVAVVGRPGKDEHALEAADVPVVLGAAGAIVGERGVTSTSDDPRDAAAALWLARAARRSALRGTGVAAIGGAALVALATFGWLVPGVAAALALAVDAYALGSASRLLRRVQLRLPDAG